MQFSCTKGLTIEMYVKGRHMFHAVLLFSWGEGVLTDMIAHGEMLATLVLVFCLKKVVMGMYSMR